jgi:dihydrofolate reductase
MGLNRVIGSRGALPWHISADLKRFKSLTLGSSIILGRKTYESFGGRPLPRRRHHVISRGSGVALEKEDGTSVVWHPSLEAALQACAQNGDDQVFIVGGAQIYEEALRQGVVTSLELTRVELAPEGDTFFPPFESDFRLVHRDEQSENGIVFSYESWSRA